MLPDMRTVFKLCYSCNQSPVAYSRSKSLSDERTHHPPSNWVCPNDRQLMLRAK